MTHDTTELDLVDKTIALIPGQAWIHVRQVIVTALVDNMPGSVVHRLTGTYDDFAQAEKILFDYYELPEKKNELIIDAFKIMGSANTLQLLESAQLERFITDDIPSTDSSAVSSMQGGQAQDN